MISSMTAFSRSERDADWGNLTWEIRSLNHRYLEPAFKLPDSLRQIEPQLRKSLKRQASRGKIDCTLKFTPQQQSSKAFNVNQDTLSSLLAACEEITRHSLASATLDPLAILAWPGLCDNPDDDQEALAGIAIELFNEALQDLSAIRVREGTELATFIRQRLDGVEQQTRLLRSQLPEWLRAQRQRILQKLESVSARLDQDRLEQELVYTAQKADIDEELDRIETHLSEARRILNKGGHCGRRLDFLMQEFNREANTLASKSISATATLAAVELKVLIEQMREQIQNIE